MLKSLLPMGSSKIFMVTGFSFKSLIYFEFIFYIYESDPVSFFCICLSSFPNTIYFLILNLFFNWRITALQNFVAFCQTSTWISHRYTFVPSPFPSYPSRLLQSPSLSSLSYTANSYWLSILHIVLLSFHVSLSIHPTLSCFPAPMPISLFPMSVYPLLPCK